MQSLRTRKPSEHRPKGQGRPSNKLARAPGPRDVVRKSTRVDDKIKKRMSMRYVDISSPTEAGIPAVPTIPLNLRPGQTRNQELIREEGFVKEDTKVADLKALDSDDFDSDAFLKAKMANSTEAELRTLQSSLQSLKDGVQLDLQRNVFKNYAEFVIVSKEVSTLENEMLEFKDSLAEWKGMPSLLHIDDSASVAERRRNVRSSIADLKVLYANQMQNLHTQIEGSAKFVPTTPGRHVITEVDTIYALNPATYRVDHSCRFVLLDDAILVARRRRRRNNTESEKLIAERCWPLNEMLVLDTKDTSSMTNVFKIRHNKETHVYRTEAAGDKKNLLTQFRQIAEELSARRQKEREGEHQRRKSLWISANGDRNSMAYAATEVPPMPEFLADLMDKSDLGMGSSAKEKAERDARWISDFADELTVAIALRKWDEATKLVEDGESKQPTMPALSTKLVPLKNQLTTALLQSLSIPTNRKSIVVHLITLLLRLEAGPAARNTFLTTRSDVMRKAIRAINFEGSVGMYIADLVIVVFTGIKHTADWFLASFKENEVASAFVEWAKQQVEHFAEMFRKQVYTPDVNAKTVENAIQVVHSQSKKLLEEFGIDFRFLLEQLLVEKPKEVARPPPFRPHQQKQPSPIYTPASTPIRSRSPAPLLSAPTPPRTRSPAPAVPPIPKTVVSPSPTASFAQSPQSAGYSPAPSPVPSPLASRSSPVSARRMARPETPENAHVPGGPRPMKGSPAPPPRSRDRPGSSSGFRPPPLAVPKRDNMF
ncbi:exocyst complex component exo84 [Steccherinum ochraceum]|uniref:Exocyst complex component EXO84 n=1 Tax=Steccherinum ochraceum TaxID=92696 RepID=A0A4R0RS47_9APHY|nr:exocyst complex component exo84 [Steccherinum ochraceum]